MFTSSRRTFRFAIHSTLSDLRPTAGLCAVLYVVSALVNGKLVEKMLRANKKPVCGWSFFRKHEYFVRREILDEWRSIRAMKNLSTLLSHFFFFISISFNQLLFTNNLLTALECRSSSSSHMRMTIFLTHLYCLLFAANPLHFQI